MARSTRVRLIGIAEHPPDLRTRRRDIVECDWHYADDGHRIVVDRDGASDDRAVRAVAPFPKPVTEDDDLIVLWDVFLGVEVAAQLRSYDKGAEVLPRYTVDGDAL